MAEILLVEDDKLLNKGIVFALNKEGYTVLSAHSIDEGERIFHKKNLNLVLLDINLPDGSGLDLCEKMRETSQVPIIFLTANDTEEQMVEGFQTGCDDYMAKPFSIEVLKQRIRAVLRRTETVTNKHCFSYRNLEIDYDKHTVKRNHEEIKLTMTEFKLLEVLARNQGQVLTRSMILEKLWDFDGKFVEENALSVNIRRLRQKIEINPKEPQYIITVFGIGYTFGE